MNGPQTNRWMQTLDKGQLLEKSDGFESYLEENNRILEKAEVQLKRVRQYIEEVKKKK